MNWHDILLEQCFDDITLQRALAQAFDVPSRSVIIVDSIENAPGGVCVVAEKTRTKGDFRCLLSLYVEPTLAPKDPVEVTHRLCSNLGIQALISDQSPNPYSMILVNKTIGARPVALDAESLDVREEYRVVRDRPLL